MWDYYSSPDSIEIFSDCYWLRKEFNTTKEKKKKKGFLHFEASKDQLFLR